MIKQKIKLIIFDLDGTLVDAYKAIEVSFNYTMRRLGLAPKTPLVIRRAVGWGDESLLQPFVPLESFKKALNIYREHHKKSLLKYSRLLPATIKVLEYFKGKGYKLAIASNRPTKFSAILIKHLKIARYFDIVLCADKIKHHKPHPEILFKIMREVSCSAKEAIYVGDMAIDVEAGKRAKVKTVAVLGGSSRKDELRREKPWKIIKDISDLPKLFYFA